MKAETRDWIAVECISFPRRRIPLIQAAHDFDGNDDQETGEYVKAWDVYLLFAPGIEWKDHPPPPSFWMHQLYSVDPKNAFDSKKLANETQRLLK